MRSKIHKASEILEAIDRIGMAQTAAYNALEGNNLIRFIVDQGVNPMGLPPELETVIKQNVAVITASFETWAKSLDRLVQLRHAFVLANSEVTSPAAVAEQIIADLAKDTEFDTL